MTAAEMVQAFKFRLDKNDSFNYPNYENQEIDLLLNQAQERIIKQRYGTSNVKKTSFEETQKRVEDLKSIVDTAIIIPAVTALDNISVNAVFCNLPINHYFTVFENCKVSYIDCDNNTVIKDIPIEGIQHNDYNKIVNNPFKKPNLEKVLRLMESGRSELIHDNNMSIHEYRIRYIRKPVTIDSVNIPNVDCELSEHLHDELVDMAVLLAIENIEAKRLQTFNALEKTNE
jgi:hypothetical protein